MLLFVVVYFLKDGKSMNLNTNSANNYC